jgi:hypothetical protein
LWNLRETWRRGKGVGEFHPTPYDQAIEAGRGSYNGELAALDAHTTQAATILARMADQRGLADSLTAMAKRMGHRWARD